MKILALDAALGCFSTALDCHGTIVADRSAGNDALETGLPRIERLLASAQLGLRDLDRIAVGIGPGSFTGIRIAVSFAKSLAYGAGIPLVGISSYDVLAPERSDLPCLTVVHGRRGVICARLADPTGTRVACGPIQEVLDTLLAGREPGESLWIAGDTEDVLPAIGERDFIVRAHPNRAENPAIIIAHLARRRDPSPSPHALAPDYGEIPAVSRPKARA